MSDILKQIDQLVTDATFSLDALDGIKQIRDSLIKTEKENADLKETCNDLLKEKDRLSTDLYNRTNEVQELKAKINEMEALVDSGKAAIFEAQKHEAVAGAWKEAMQTVFKPNTVRETVSRSIPIPINPGNGASSYVSSYGETSSVVREEG